MNRTYKSGFTDKLSACHTLIAKNAIHPVRIAEISRWSPRGAPPVKKRGATHPEGMPETRIWHASQGAAAIFSTYPVVALCLPPANFLNRFAVKHTIHNYILHITMQAIDITRALNLSVNPVRRRGRPEQAKRRSGKYQTTAGTALRLVRPTDSTQVLNPVVARHRSFPSAGFSRNSKDARKSRCS